MMEWTRHQYRTKSDSSGNVDCRTSYIAAKEQRIGQWKGTGLGSSRQLVLILCYLMIINPILSADNKDDFSLNWRRGRRGVHNKKVYWTTTGSHYWSTKNCMSTENMQTMDNFYLEMYFLSNFMLFFVFFVVVYVWEPIFNFQLILHAKLLSISVK